MVEIKTVWDGDTTSYLVIANGNHVSSHWTYEEAKVEADKYEEGTTMEKIKFELNGIAYESNEKGNRFYKIIGTQKVRISEAEWTKAKNAYDAECDSHLPDWAEVWEQEANAEKQAREDKVTADAKSAEQAVAKKTKKNVAFEHEGITLTEKQVRFLKLLPNDDFFENGLESTLWIDVLCDTVASEFNPMAVGAMVSTLREKNLIYVAQENVNGKKCKYFGFTPEGKEVALALGLE